MNVRDSIAETWFLDLLTNLGVSVTLLHSVTCYETRLYLRILSEKYTIVNYKVHFLKIMKRHNM